VSAISIPDFGPTRPDLRLFLDQFACSPRIVKQEQLVKRKRTPSIFGLTCRRVNYLTVSLLTWWSMKQPAFPLTLNIEGRRLKKNIT